MIKFGTIALFAILVTSIGISPTFAQLSQLDLPILVSTDKSSYSEGETIIISGSVRDLISGTPVTLQIFSPLDTQVAIDQLEVNSDGTFMVEISTGGPLWKNPGTYDVLVQYGSQSRTNETSFEYGGGSGVIETPSTGNSIALDTTDLMISYEITGGKVLSISPDIEAASLIIAIETTSDGVLTMVLPPSIIKAELPDGAYDTYFVLIDGQEEDFDDDMGDTARTLTISFIDGSEEIEIIGTWVVPEFGTIAIMILAVAIVSIIAVSARSRLSILPKY